MPWEEGRIMDIIIRAQRGVIRAFVDVFIIYLLQRERSYQSIH